MSYGICIVTKNLLSEVLQELPEFIFGRYAYKFDESGRVVSALPYDEDEKFWNEDYKETNGNRIPVFEYDYVAAKTFFQNRGIGRYRLLDTKLWTYIHLDPPVVRTIDVEDARDFMFAFSDVKACFHPTQFYISVP